MAALYDSKLPCTVCGIKVNTDWRVMADFESDSHRIKKGGEKAFIAKHLAAFYGVRPKDARAALDGMLWFYQCGGRDKRKHHTFGRINGLPYDFEADAELLVAAFRQAYGIDLIGANMHWWEFRALMNNLPEETKFVKVEGWRVADLSGMNDKQRDYYERMKELYALPPEIGGESIYARHTATQEEAEADFIARLRRE